ncbi:lysophosphatidic acid receptor 6-like [Tachysurus ichikawai]
MFAYPPPLNSGPLIFSLPVITFCCIATLQALRKSDPGRKGIHPQKKRALVTIFNSLVLTCVVYTPPVVIFSFADVFPVSRNQYQCAVGVFGFTLSMSGCVIVPILHLDTMGKFDNLKDLLKKSFCTCYCITAHPLFPQ